MNFGQRSMLEVNAWVIRARWIYLVIIFSIVFFSLLTGGGVAVGIDQSSLTVERLIGVVQLAFLALLFNLIIGVWAWRLRRRALHNDISRWLSVLGSVQVLIDLVLIAALIYTSNLPASIFPVFFFVPIVESVLFFNWVGPIAAATVAGILANTLNYLSFASRPRELFLSAASAGLFYLIIGFFCSYLAGLIKERSDLLAREDMVNQLQQEAEQNLGQERSKMIAKQTREMTTKELELTIANKRLARLDEAKSKFVTVTAHQMRTPLSAMKWTFDMILSNQLGPLNAEQVEFLKKGQMSTNRLIDEVNRLLNIDNLETRETAYHFTRVALEDVVSLTIDGFGNQAKSKNINLRFIRPTNRLPDIELDQQKVRMALENLIDNAIKYTRSGGEISISIKDDLVNSAQNCLEVVVADQGVGIREDERDRIFQKFFRSENVVTLEPNGSGLGLYLTKEIIEKHGGAIWFNSRDGGGTEFHFTLPLHHKGV